MKKILYYIEDLSLEAFHEGLDSFGQLYLSNVSSGIAINHASQYFTLYKKGPFHLQRTAIVLKSNIKAEATGILLEAELKYIPTFFDLALGLIWSTYPFILQSFSWLWLIMLMLYPLLLQLQIRELKNTFLEIPAFLYEQRLAKVTGEEGDDGTH